MSRIIKEWDADGTLLATYKSMDAAAKANHVTDSTIHASIRNGAVTKKLGKYFTVEYVAQSHKKAKNNCPVCYYGHKLGADWACMYYIVKGIGNRRPCKVEDCEIWKLSPKGTKPLPLTVKEAPKKKNTLSKAQANHLAAIIMGDSTCPACKKKLDRDAVFCKYCGAKVKKEEV